MQKVKGGYRVRATGGFGRLFGPTLTEHGSPAAVMGFSPTTVPTAAKPSRSQSNLMCGHWAPCLTANCLSPRNALEWPQTEGYQRPPAVILRK